jgi:hypothetical protein
LYDETGYVANFRGLKTRARPEKREREREREREKSITALTGKKEKLKTEEMKSIETGNKSTGSQLQEAKA